MDQSPIPHLLPVSEVIRRGPWGRTKFYELLNAGAIPAVKVGRRTYVPADAVAKYLYGLKPYLHNRDPPGGDSGS